MRITHHKRSDIMGQEYKHPDNVFASFPLRCAGKFIIPAIHFTISKKPRAAARHAKSLGKRGSL